MRSADRKHQNYLEYVPSRAAKYAWSRDEAGAVTIHMEHDGFCDRIAQKFFHRPRVSHIALDQMGSFVWAEIDGQQTVGEIADKVKEHFAEKADPLYERLICYMKILHNNGFIH